MSPLYVKSNPNPEKICTELDCIPVESSLLWRNANFFRLVGAILLSGNAK